MTIVIGKHVYKGNTVYIAVSHGKVAVLSTTDVLKEGSIDGLDVLGLDIKETREIPEYGSTAYTVTGINGAGLDLYSSTGEYLHATAEIIDKWKENGSIKFIRSDNVKNTDGNVYIDNICDRDGMHWSLYGNIAHIKGEYIGDLRMLGTKIIMPYEFYEADVRNVVLKSNGIHIGSNAFKGSRIKTLRIYSNDYVIGDSAFEGCRELEAVEFTGSIKEIGRKAFSGCPKLRKVQFEGSVWRCYTDSFDSHVFENSIFEEKVQYINSSEHGALRGDSRGVLTVVGQDKYEKLINAYNSLSRSLELYTDMEIKIIEKLDSRFVKWCPVSDSVEKAFGKSVDLDRMAIVERDADSNKITLASSNGVILESTDRGISEYEHSGPLTMSELIVKADAADVKKGMVKKVNDSRYEALNKKLALLGMNDYAYDAIGNVIILNKECSEIQINDSRALMPYLFTNTNIQKAVIHTGMVYCKAFYSSSIEEIDLYTECIDDAAFYQCYRLKRITLHEGLKHIGADAFKMCSALESIDIPESVEFIGHEAYYKYTHVNGLDKCRYTIKKNN